MKLDKERRNTLKESIINVSNTPNFRKSPLMEARFEKLIDKSVEDGSAHCLFASNI
jgi:hypothetical protein